MKIEPSLCLVLVSAFFCCVYSTKADQAWSSDQKRAFVEQYLANTNAFVVNVPADKNPHRGLSLDAIQALWNQASENGTMVYLYSDGSLQGFYSNQRYKENGPAKRWYPNGQLAVDEEYDHGKLVVGTYYDENGQLLCSMTNGTGRKLGYPMQRTGEPRTVDCIIGEYKDGVENGVETTYSNFAKREKLSESHYKDGKQDGVEVNWYNGKKTSERNFTHGLQDGFEVIWYPSGQTNAISHYRNGKLDGSSVQFLPDGTKYREIVYRTNEVVSEKSWFTNGVLMAELTHGEKGMMAKSYDYTGQQNGEVISGNGTLAVITPGLPGFEIKVYKDGKMVDDRRIRLFAKLVPHDANISPSAQVVPFHLEVFASDEPLKTFAATLHLPEGVTHGGDLSFTVTNIEFHQFEPFDLKFPVPYQQWTGDITADVRVKLLDCSIQSQTVVLHQ